MDDIVGPLKAYLQKSDSAVTDNLAFKLHYRATSVVLLVCMMLVSAGQFLGDPINCIADGVPGGTLDLYCWIHSTFSIPSRWGKLKDEYGEGTPYEIARNNPHPGIAPLEPGEEVVYHKYYQWVVFVLFIQAVMFHVPRIIWKHAEGGLMKNLVGDLTNPIYIVKKDERMDQVMNIKKYFKDATKTHGGYAIKFFLCEVLAIVNVMGQMYLTDRFLGNQFTTYGFDVLAVMAGNSEDRSDPMNVVFPKMTKCTFHSYGPSGTINTHDSLCILALNIINEKIYVFLWFWFVGLALFSLIALLYRLIILIVHRLRVSVLMARLHNTVNKKMVEDVLSCPTHSWIDQIGDYWVIYLLSKNLPPVAMKELLEELKPILNPTPPYGYETLGKDTDM
eukprot:GFUD01000999.1.p1 GENE.GFUD01000999.1~~GFUD01000999.1.p1  ORF type:complete len:391 (+),score=69.13 GFUD01000999.1:54-1226(+)